MLNLDDIEYRSQEVTKNPLGNLVKHIASKDISGYTTGGIHAAVASVNARERSAADVPDLLAEVRRLQASLDLFMTMPIVHTSFDNSREAHTVTVDIINFTKALDVAKGETHPSEWVNDPCKFATKTATFLPTGKPEYGFSHTPHWWTNYPGDSRTGDLSEFEHWCNGELTV